MLRTLATLTLLIITMLLGLTSTRAADLTTPQKVKIEIAVEHAVERNADLLNTEKIHSILSKIDNLKMRARLTQRAVYTLDYLKALLIERLEPITITTGSTISLNILPNQQSVNPPITNLSYTRGPKTILAGVESPVIAKFELSALYEDIQIKDFHISSANNLDSVIESVQIYNASGIRIAQGFPINNSITWNNQNLLIKQGTQSWYMTVTARSVGYNHSAPSNISYQLQLHITRALGFTSTEQVSVTTSNHLSDSITIRPFLITKAQLSNSLNGNTSNPLLSNGTTTLGFLQLGINSNSNTNTTTTNQNYKIIPTEITLSLGNNIAGTINAITLRNVNGGTSINGVIQNGKVSFYLTQIPSSERTIEAGGDGLFVITLDATLSSSVSESISLSMDTTSVSFMTNEDNTIYTDLGLGAGFSSSLSVKE